MASPGTTEEQNQRLLAAGINLPAIIEIIKIDYKRLRSESKLFETLHGSEADKKWSKALDNAISDITSYALKRLGESPLTAKANVEAAVKGQQ